MPDPQNPIDGMPLAVDPYRSARTRARWAQVLIGLVDDSGPVPAGVFRPEPDDGTLLLVEGIAPGIILAMTEEPAGGSDEPTGEILSTAEL